MSLQSELGFEAFYNSCSYPKAPAYLKLLEAAAADPEAARDLSFFCIHGCAPDGVASAGAAPTQWQGWRDGWTSRLAAGLPATVKGFAA